MPVTRLTHIFRQAQGSLIIQNAHRINRGEKIAVSTPNNTDNQTGFFRFERDAPGDILTHTLRVVTEWLPQQGGYSRKTSRCWFWVRMANCCDR